MASGVTSGVTVGVAFGVAFGVTSGVASAFLSALSLSFFGSLVASASGSFVAFVRFNPESSSLSLYTIPNSFALEAT